MAYRKINFCGSSCTGKTSLVEAMKKDPEFQNWKFYQHVVRDLREKGLKINEQSNYKTQQVIFEKFDKILSQMNEDSFSVSERCIIDVAAFTSALFDRMDSFDRDLMDMCHIEFFQRKEIIRRANDLPLVVYTPIEFDVIDDGERLIDEELRRVFDQKIQQILKNSKIPHITVRGTIEQRLLQIKEVVFSDK